MGLRVVGYLQGLPSEIIAVRDDPGLRLRPLSDAKEVGSSVQGLFNSVGLRPIMYLDLGILAEGDVGVKLPTPAYLRLQFVTIILQRVSAIDA